MKIPKQAEPVSRETVSKPLVEPHLTVDIELLEENYRNLKELVEFLGEPNTAVEDGLEKASDALLEMKFELAHGANYNDPMVFSTPAGFCGCQLLSGQAREICAIACGWF